MFAVQGAGLRLDGGIEYLVRRVGNPASNKSSQDKYGCIDTYSSKVLDNKAPSPIVLTMVNM